MPNKQIANIKCCTKYLLENPKYKLFSTDPSLYMVIDD